MGLEEKATTGSWSALGASRRLVRRLWQSYQRMPEENQIR